MALLPADTATAALQEAKPEVSVATRVLLRRIWISPAFPEVPAIVTLVTAPPV